MRMAADTTQESKKRSPPAFSGKKKKNYLPALFIDHSSKKN